HGLFRFFNPVEAGDDPGDAQQSEHQTDQAKSAVVILVGATKHAAEAVLQLFDYVFQIIGTPATIAATPGILVVAPATGLIPGHILLRHLRCFEMLLHLSALE